MTIYISITRSTTTLYTVLEVSSFYYTVLIFAAILFLRSLYLFALEIFNMKVICHA